MTYPLLPYSQFVYDLRKTFPDAYEGHGFLRYRLSELNPLRLEKALRLVIRHHPVFGMRMDDNGQTPVPVEDELQTPFFKVTFTADQLYGYIEIRYNRILFDGYSFSLLAEDLYRTYNGLPLEKDDYIGYLFAQQEHLQSDTYRRHRDEMIARFGSLTCPLQPVPDTRLEAKLPSADGNYTLTLNSLHESIEQMSRRYILPSDAVFAAAVLFAIMDYNHTSQAAITWAYADREIPQNARIIGSVHKDIPLVLEHSRDKEGIIRQIRNQIRYGIAHSDYPLTLLPPYNRQWNYALNLIHDQMIEFDNSFPIEPYRTDETTFPTYSLFDIFIQDRSELSLNFRYSAAHYRKESIDRFANLIYNNLLWLTA